MYQRGKFIRTKYLKMCQRKVTFKGQGNHWNRDVRSGPLTLTILYFFSRISSYKTESHFRYADECKNARVQHREPILLNRLIMNILRHIFGKRETKNTHWFALLEVNISSAIPREDKTGSLRWLLENSLIFEAIDLIRQSLASLKQYMIWILFPFLFISDSYVH